MTRRDLAKRLGRKFPGITGTDARELLDLFLDAMKAGLRSGDTVEIRDFGVLRVKKSSPRNARNPRSGETFTTKTKNVVRFKQSRILKGILKKSVFTINQGGLT